MNLSLLCWICASFRPQSPTAQLTPQIWSELCSMWKACTLGLLYWVLVYLLEGEWSATSSVHLLDFFIIIFPILLLLCSMILLNYLAHKRTESGMVAGITISVAWDALKSSDSMEEPLNWFLFNKHLTNGLRQKVTRLLSLHQSLPGE